MAKKTVLVSDISGEPISGAAAHVRIALSSKPHSSFELDASEAEVDFLIVAARERKRRGRPSKA